MSEGPLQDASGGLGEDAARELLSGTERVRRQARAHRRLVAAPLYVLGALLLVYALLNLIDRVHLENSLSDGITYATGQPALQTFLESYWATMGALGLVGIGIWFAVRRQRTGAGPGGLAWIVGGVAILLLVWLGGYVLPLTPLFLVAGFLAPTLFIAVPLLVIAVQRRSTRLAAWVVAFGVVTVLGGLGFFTNRLGDLVRLTGLESRVSLDVIVSADLAVLLLFALILLGAAEHARRATAQLPS